MRVCVCVCVGVSVCAFGKAGVVGRSKISRKGREEEEEEAATAAPTAMPL